jgi:hypothetical protein
VRPRKIIDATMEPSEAAGHCPTRIGEGRDAPRDASDRHEVPRQDEERDRDQREVVHAREHALHDDLHRNGAAGEADERDEAERERDGNSDEEDPEQAENPDHRPSPPLHRTPEERPERIMTRNAIITDVQSGMIAYT